MAKNLDAARFERVDKSSMVGTSHIRYYSGLGIGIGDLLSRIWALYGPHDVVLFEGFGYVFKDHETGLIFTAYSAGSGPGFGGHPSESSKLQPVLDSFEQLLSKTRPADCQIEFETDFGLYRSGARNGIPFDEEAS